jgi:SecD/SecF fusion protein
VVRITKWKVLFIVLVVGFAVVVDGLGWISRVTQTRTSKVAGGASAQVFNVTAGTGTAFRAHKAITVAGQGATVQSVKGDTITLDKPVANTPTKGAEISQSGGFDMIGQTLTSAPSLFGRDTLLQKGLDIQGGTQLTIAVCAGPNNPPVSGLGAPCRNGPANGTSVTDARDQTIPVLEQRVNGLGVSEATVQPDGSDKVLIQLPGISLEQAENVIGKTAKLHFATPKQNPRDFDPAQLAANPDPNCAPTDNSALCQVVRDQGNLFDVSQLSDANLYPTGYHWLIDEKIPANEVTGADVGSDQAGGPTVDLTFGGGAGDEWNSITNAAFAAYQTSPTSPTAHIAIFLDNHIISAPVVTGGNQGNKTQIQNIGDVNAANTLASQIKSGALPAEITTVAATEVSPTLGQDTVKKTLIGGAIGLIVVILFMIGYYRFPGLLASAALLIYSTLNLAVYKLIGVPISLAGLAGFVLSVGMAVDANVLIFERTRDELRHGRGVGVAVETGFRRAFPAIRDSNISTLIACAVLYSLGSGVVKGFAATLAIGVALSFFSAVLITQSLLAWVLRWRIGRNPRLYTEVHPEYEQAPPRGRFDIIRARNLYFLGSLLVIVPGIIAILFWHDSTSPHGFRLGLDFSGGDRLEATFKGSPTTQGITDLINGIDTQLHPLVQDEGHNAFAIQISPSNTSTVQKVVDSLDKKFQFARDSSGRPIVSRDVVGPSIASALVVSAVVLIIVASALIAAYLWFQFRKARAIQGWRFAVVTFIKLLHDVFVLLGIWAILGHFTDVGQVDQLFVTAVLTGVAFSIHDTIVVFDRIRENLRVGPRLTFDQTINLSTVQTMTRSLNTSLTVVFVMLALLLAGSSTIRGFVLALLVGIVTGTYSSIFNASTLLVAWQKTQPQDSPGGRGRPRRTVQRAA